MILWPGIARFFPGSPAGSGDATSNRRIIFLPAGFFCARSASSICLPLFHYGCKSADSSGTRAFCQPTSSCPPSNNNAMSRASASNASASCPHCAGLMPPTIFWIFNAPPEPFCPFCSCSASRQRPASPCSGCFIFPCRSSARISSASNGTICCSKPASSPYFSRRCGCCQNSPARPRHRESPFGCCGSSCLNSCSLPAA